MDDDRLSEELAHFCTAEHATIDHVADDTSAIILQVRAFDGICAFCAREKRTSKMICHEIDRSNFKYQKFHYDELGRHHTHDSSVHGKNFHCSNGHVGQIDHTKNDCRVPGCNPVDDVKTMWTSKQPK